MLPGRSIFALSPSLKAGITHIRKVCICNGLTTNKLQSNTVPKVVYWFDFQMFIHVNFSNIPVTNAVRCGTLGNTYSSSGSLWD